MAELHLAKQALALVNRHGARLGNWLPRQLAWQPLLVTGVAGFMDYAHQAGDKLLLVVSGGDAHVGRYTAAEGVTAHIKPAMGEVKTEQPHYLLTECLLGRDGEWALRQQYGLFLLPLADLLDKGRQPAGEIAEDLIEPRAGHARLIECQHGVVGAHAELVCPQTCHLSGELHHLFEIGGKTGPVVVFALAAPGVLALAAGERQRLDQFAGQQAGILPLALDFAQVGALHLVQLLALCLGNPVAQFGGGALVVDDEAELSQRFGTRLIAPFRHHGGAIPATDGGEVVEAVQLLLVLFKFLV